jgi:hypothetical protein
MLTPNSATVIGALLACTLAVAGGVLLMTAGIEDESSADRVDPGFRGADSKSPRIYGTVNAS